ncbi:hypothetical protein B0T26DRAFT_39623 [Lasiosphaeria miniovina]|uniref:Uncharacterized protein n=1 Tax=Lasiosphaeria miniovina TaxID=1954250 RepID=A0AA40BH27_9PEZI|nr:uncharacterized protein B0T26DRAFT_39623 [Lasiosphaeria miniovina]KAK0733853.1 hypothetical protein B0T26DRAFT_39623 [Lasiosphaeria miniovina]
MGSGSVRWVENRSFVEGRTGENLMMGALYHTTPHHTTTVRGAREAWISGRLFLLLSPPSGAKELFSPFSHIKSLHAYNKPRTDARCHLDGVYSVTSRKDEVGDQALGACCYLWIEYVGWLIEPRACPAIVCACVCARRAGSFPSVSRFHLSLHLADGTAGRRPRKRAVLPRYIACSSALQDLDWAFAINKCKAPIYLVVRCKVGLWDGKQPPNRRQFHLPLLPSTIRTVQLSSFLRLRSFGLAERTVRESWPSRNAWQTGLCDF